VPPKGDLVKDMRGQFLAIMGSRILASLLQAINVILLARAVTPSDIGLTSAILGVCMVLFTVTDFGLSKLVIKTYACEDHGTVASALRLITLTTWTFGTLALLGGLGLSALGVFPVSLTVLILAVAIDRCVEYRLGVAIAANSKAIPSTSILLRRGAQFAVFLLLFTTGVPALWAYSLAQLLGAAAGYLQTTFVLRRLVTRVAARRPIREVLSKAFAFFVQNVTSVIGTLDTFLVSAFSGAHNAGLYAAASRGTSPLLLIPGTLSESVLPHASRATPSQARELGLRLVIVFLGILLLGGPVGFIVAEPLCTLVYGDAYRGAGLPLAILLLGLPFAILAGGLRSVLQGQGQENFVAKVGVAFSFAFVLAVAVGGAMYGAMGAAVASSTIMFAVNCLPLIVRVAQIHESPGEEEMILAPEPRVSVRGSGGRES
jgi:O-antigen/teichoic acid export membrane protein